MNNSIVVYHYGDCGDYDDNNPFKIISEEGISEILFLIGKSEPFTISISDLNESLNIEKETLSIYIEKMKNLKMIEEKDNRYSTNFTIIYEEDLEVIDRFSKLLASKISELIYNQKEKIELLAKELFCANSFSVDEILYHIIGCEILDGSAIDTLSSKELIKTSKIQTGDRDYILFGFQKSSAVDEFSENLLCSCNNYHTENLSFVSFGDSTGNRNDFYRFGRQVVSQINKVNASSETKSSYIRLLEKSNDEIGKRCASLIFRIIKEDNSYSDEDMDYIEYLISFGYVKRVEGSYKISVPVIYPEDKKIINHIHDLVMAIVLPILKDDFSNAGYSLNISSVLHGVDIKEILNEMWHQVFGNINEKLVEKKLIKTPDYFKGEGRYLKAIYIK